jgi:hypothetical protein
VHIAAAGALTLKRLTLQDGNVGLFTGGALGNAGTLTMRRVIVAHNRSGFFGGGLSNQGTLRIAQTIFMGNLSLFGGGGIFTTGGTVTITQTTFVNNIADGGGGLEMGEVPPGGGTVAITNSSFVDNNGLFQGGGGLWNAGEVLTLTNTTVARNRADGLFPGGGGLRNSGTTRILHSTFAENSIRFSRAGRAGGISTSSGTVEVQNTILARNTVGTSDQASDCAGPVTSLGHNLIGDPTGCAISLQGTDLTGDPGLDAFTDDGTPGDGHFPLLPTSQAIDAGNDAVCPRRDQLRERRVSPCDIGAIEFQGGDPAAAARGL